MGQYQQWLHYREVDLSGPAHAPIVLMGPQWRSWLVRGAYGLTAYGAVLTMWLIAELVGAETFGKAVEILTARADKGSARQLQTEVGDAQRFGGLNAGFA